MKGRINATKVLGGSLILDISVGEISKYKKFNVGDYVEIRNLGRKRVLRNTLPSDVITAKDYILWAARK